MARRRKPRNKQFPAKPASATPSPALESGKFDTQPFIADIESKMPKELMPIYKMAILKGDLQIFSKETYEMTLEQLKAPGPMAEKLAKGICAVVYILFQKSNKTLPPQILEPVGYTLLCHAFDFLQMAGDPEATKEMFGEAAHGVSVGIHNALGVSEEQFNAAVAQSGQKPQPGILGAQA